MSLRSFASLRMTVFWLASSEERFLRCANRRVGSEANAEENASVRFGRNDRCLRSMGIERSANANVIFYTRIISHENLGLEAAKLWADLVRTWGAAMLRPYTELLIPAGSRLGWCD